MVEYTIAHYLPKKTTSISQPIDVDVIALIKKRYTRRDIELGVDLIEHRMITNVYNVDLKIALE